MRCPNPSCQSDHFINENTYARPDQIGMPAEFKILNITRRRKHCHDCNTVFFTIELPEVDYRRLMKLSGRLDAGQPRVRP